VPQFVLHPEIIQLTPVLLLPETAAVNCCALLAPSCTLVGEIVTATLPLLPPPCVNFGSGPQAASNSTAAASARTRYFEKTISTSSPGGQRLYCRQNCRQWQRHAA